MVNEDYINATLLAVCEVFLLSFAEYNVVDIV